MKHLTLTLSLILGLATIANANEKRFSVGDVFFCQMEAFTEWNWKERNLKNYKLEKFKFSIVDAKTIKFGEGGYFQASDMSIDRIGSKVLKAVTSRNAVMSLHENKFTLASSYYLSGSVIAATCDRF